jgi:hypothetical protein
MDKLSSYATTIAGDGGTMRVTYHSTVIAEWTADTITLRTGGWDTVTTRRKMNQTARQFGLGFNVYRDGGESFVTLPGGCAVPLDREVTFSRDAIT